MMTALEAALALGKLVNPPVKRVFNLALTRSYAEQQCIDAAAVKRIRKAERNLKLTRQGVI